MRLPLLALALCAAPAVAKSTPAPAPLISLQPLTDVAQTHETAEFRSVGDKSRSGT